MPRCNGGGNTEVERSGQNVWDPLAEGMEIIMGEKCLIRMRLKDIL